MDRNAHMKELGIDERAQREDLILAYRRLMIQWHPERVKPSEIPDALRRTAAITSAFQSVEKSYPLKPTRPSLEKALRMSDLAKTYGPPRLQNDSLEPISLTFSPARSLTELGLEPKLKNLGGPTKTPPREAKWPIQSTALIGCAVVMILLIAFSLVKEESHQRPSPIVAPVPQTRPVTSTELNRTEPSPSIPAPTNNGRILVHTNRPSALIEIRRQDGSGPTFHAPADNDRIEFTSLPSGEYLLTARLKGWPDVTKTIALSQNQETEVSLDFVGGSLRIESDPSDAAVAIGGKAIGQTPLTIKDLPPGSQTITLQYKTWPEVSTAIAVEANHEANATIRIPYGQLDIETSPSGTMVAIDGVEMGRTPMVINQIPAGQRRLRLTAENRESYETQLSIADHGTLKIHPVLISNIAQLNPNTLLNLVWTNGQQVGRKYDIAPDFESTANFRPKNGVIKNLDRQKLYEKWADRLFRYEGMVKWYDPQTGVLEFADESGEKSKYRITARLSPRAKKDQALLNKLLKGAQIEIFGRFSAIEEPRWPSKTILFELNEAEPVN